LETTVIDRRGMVTERAYDERGNLLAVIERGETGNPLARPSVTRYTYNLRNEVTSIADAKGNVTLFDFDPNGNVTRITNALGDSSTFTYDAQGRRSSFTDFNGNTTLMEYHAGCDCGAPSKVIYPDGTYQAYEYNDFGQITLEQTFEADGRLVERKQTEYDELGRVTRELIGGGSDLKHPVSDVRKFYSGQLLAWEIIVSPASLDVNGQLLESPLTPVTQRKSRITEYRYDARDQMITQIDAMGGVIDYRYDAQGNRVLLRDPVGNITTWVYDSLNRVIEERDPFYWVDFVAANSTLSTAALLVAVVEENKKPGTASLAANRGAPHVRAFGYDAEGNQVEVIDRNDRRREFTYDHAGRLLEERWFAAANGSLVETMALAYDAVGNLESARNGGSAHAYQYDQYYRLKSVDNLDTNPQTPRVILVYEYDRQGNRIRTSDDAGVAIESTYDKRNQLATRKWFDAIVPAGGSKDIADTRVDFVYTAAGRQKQVRRYADLNATTKIGSTDFTYDLSGRTNRLVHKDAVDALLASYDYGYDFSGLVVDEIRDHSRGSYDDAIAYRYDLNAQLIDAAFEGQGDESYAYDLNGNRRSAVIGGEARTYSTGQANQVISDGVYRYEYDGEGNPRLKIRVSDGQVTESFWDHRNRLIRVEERSAGGIILRTAEYRYDAFGRRITEIVDGQVMLRAVHNGNDTWGDYDQAGNAKTRYLFSDDTDHLLVSQSVGELPTWYHGDHLGTNRDLLVGNTLSTVEYEAFGRVLTSDINLLGSRFLFTGRELQGSGDYYFRARTDDPVLGRFAQQDPIAFGGGDLNLYRYVFNSPLAGTDPTGKVSAIEYAVLVGAVSGAILAPTFDIVCQVALNQINGRPMDISVTRSLKKMAVGAFFGAVSGAAIYHAAIALSASGNAFVAARGAGLLSNTQRFIKVPTFGLIGLGGKVAIAKDCDLLEVIAGGF
jgi:RHS repeat-associated protein